MNNTSFWWAFWPVALVVAIAAWALIRAFNRPEGERYLRQQAQGPFAPLEDEGAKPPGPT